MSLGEEPEVLDGGVPWGVVALAGAITALGPLSMDMYLPGLPAMAADFGASPGATRATISAFLIGLAVGQFVYGPLSDRVGRRWPVIFGVVLYVIATLICVFAPSIEVVIFGRFLQAIGASAGLVIARASIRDRYGARQSARVLSLLMMVSGLAPILAPSIGGVLASASGWQSIFWFKAAIAVGIGLWAFVSFQETRPDHVAETAKSEPLPRTFAVLLRNKVLVGFVLAGAFNAGAFFAFLSSSSDLFIGVYGLSPAHFGWLISLNAAGFIGMTQLNAHLLRRHTPEAILSRSRLVSIVFVVALIFTAFTGFGGMWGVLVPLLFVMASFGLVGPNTQAASLNVDPSRAGAISSLLGAASFGVGAVIAVLTGVLDDGTARPMAAAIMIAVLISTAALYGLARPGRRPAA
jgi:MFS transporter, DHA1 family, multidrug resistance protein